MYVVAAWQATVAVGDLCALDTTANFTIKDSVDNELPLGVQRRQNADSTVAVIEVYGGYTAVRAFTTDAALGVGNDLNVKGAGTNIVDDGAGVHALVISDPGGGGTAYALV